MSLLSVVPRTRCIVLYLGYGETIPVVQMQEFSQNLKFQEESHESYFGEAKQTTWQNPRRNDK